MRSVAWTDVVQGLLLLSGMIIAGLATVTALGGPRSFSRSVGFAIRSTFAAGPFWSMVALETHDDLRVRFAGP